MYFVHSFPDRFIIYHSLRFVELLIDRSTGSIQKRTQADHLAGNQIDANVHSEKCDLIVGIVQLLRCKYLIICTNSIPIGEYHGSAVRQAMEFKLLPYESERYLNTANSLTPNQLKDEQIYLSLLNRVLSTGKWYFSYDGDITLSSQRLAEFHTGSQSASQTASHPYQRADPRFFWNRFVAGDLLAAQAEEFIVPLMNGYFFQQRMKIRNKEILFTLVSRRSKERAGKRFVTRGIDIHGNVANFAETEQLISVFDSTATGPSASSASTATVYSYLQTRGSIPVFWAQPVTMKYTPKIQITKEGKETELAFRRHFDYQTSHYGRNICLSLINQKGSEKALMDAYTQQVQSAASPAIRLVNWDFHHECRKMKFENVANLMKIVEDEFAPQGYFCGILGRGGAASAVGGAAAASASAAAGNNNNGKSRFLQIQSRQSGVFRTNCIDCLDRTNVVQSVLAKRLMTEQLIAATGMTVNELAQLGALEQMFKNVWANNADAMSIPYSGTGALKTDYTRTGKRSTKGAIADGINSLTRYYLNNFKDGANQDSIDLFLGVYKPSVHLESPFVHLHSSIPSTTKKASPGYQKSVTSFVWRFTLSMFLVVAAYTFLAPTHMKPYVNYHISTQLFLFSTISFAVGAKLLLRYGRQYVSKPALRPKDQ